MTDYAFNVDPNNLYGSVGEVNGVNTPDISKLPDWLKSQFAQTTGSTGGDSAQEYTTYANSKAAGGGFLGKDGQTIMRQIGDPRKLLNEPGKSGEWLKDPSKAVFDPEMGWITPLDNIGSKSATASWGPAAAGLLLTGGMLSGGAGGLFDSIFGGAAPATEDAGLNMANAFTGVPSGAAATSEDIGLNMANPFADSVGVPGAATENPTLYNAVYGDPYTPYTGPADSYSVMNGVGNFGPGAMDQGASAGIFDSAGNPLYQSPGWWDRLTGALSGASSTFMKALPALSTASKFLSPGAGKAPVGSGLSASMGAAGSRGGGGSGAPTGTRGQAEIDPFTKLRQSQPIKTLGDYLKGT